MIISLVLAFTTTLFLQSEPTPTAAKLKAAHEQAKRCGEVTIKGDYGSLLDLTHPSLIREAGGREVLLKAMEEAMRRFKEEGLAFERVEVEAPKQVTRGGSDLFCIIPTIMVMKAPKTTISARSYFLAISDDDGKSWKFLEGQAGEKKLRKLVPNVPGDLRFPAVEKPTVKRNDNHKDE